MCSSILIPTNSAYASGVDYSITVAPSLNVTIPSSSVILSLNPNTKTFAASEDFNITVATNNPTGYELIMSSNSTSLNRDSSLDGKTATIDTLPTLAGGYTDSTFVANKWGYKKNNGNYFPLSVGGDQILKNYYPTSGDTTTLNFASKINNDQPAGSYSTTIAFTAVAYPLVNYIQNITPGACPSDSPILVVDRRDNEEYYIQKLADGNCWMLDNLRLDPTQVDLDLLQDNTNATNEILARLKNGGSGSNVYTNYAVSSAWTSSSQNYYDRPMIAASGTSDNGDWTKDTVPSVTYGTYGSGKIGVYYNYCAASAGSYCYAEGASSGNIQYDICPAGWEIPSGSTAIGSYYYLYNTAYSGNQNNFKDALSITLSGRFYDGSAGYQGSYGVFWSSTSKNDDIYYLDNGISSVNPQNLRSRNFGYTVRCMLKDRRSLSDINYMQDINPDVVKNTATGATKTLEDARDNKQYTVAKLNDGNIWMTSNLNLAGGTKLYSETSNVPAGYPESGGTGYYQLPASETISSGAAITNSNAFSNAYTAYVLNTGNETTDQANCTSSRPCNSYYSWLAATAGGKDSNGNSVSTNGKDTAYSICPKGWKLPSSGSISDSSATSTTGFMKGDFYKLTIQYGMTPGNYAENPDNTPTFYTSAGSGTIPNFLAAGACANGLCDNVGSRIYYWSSSSSTSSDVGYDLYADSSSVYSAGNSSRRNGMSVRCLAAV